MSVDAPRRTAPRRTAPLHDTTQVEAHLRSVLRAQALAWSGTAHAEELLAHLEVAVTGGGKMLRPRFARLGHLGAGGGNVLHLDGEDPVVRLGAALELLHAFALVHDDVMDGSATRRGRPSAHARQATDHAERQWLGERRRFSEGMAVLVGDLAFSLAQRLAADLPAPALRVWHEMCTELVLGQYLDVRGTAAGERCPHYAETVALLKSARYTVVRPMMLGAALAGRLDEVRSPYLAYGEPLGQAFQLRDDLLGVFGNPAVTGKPADDDLREGKPTLLLALATEHAPASARPLLERVGSPDLTDAEADALRDLFTSTGAMDQVARRIASCVQQAEDALESAALDPAAVEGLHAMAIAAAWRDR